MMTLMIVAAVSHPAYRVNPTLIEKNSMTLTVCPMDLTIEIAANASMDAMPINARTYAQVVKKLKKKNHTRQATKLSTILYPTPFWYIRLSFRLATHESGRAWYSMKTPCRKKMGVQIWKA